MEWVANGMGRHAVWIMQCPNMVDGILRDFLHKLGIVYLDDL
jgi:hypothetical protein